MPSLPRRASSHSSPSFPSGDDIGHQRESSPPPHRLLILILARESTIHSSIHLESDNIFPGKRGKNAKKVEYEWMDEEKRRHPRISHRILNGESAIRTIAQMECPPSSPLLFPFTFLFIVSSSWNCEHFLLSQQIQHNIHFRCHILYSLIR